MEKNAKKIHLKALPSPSSSSSPSAVLLPHKHPQSGIKTIKNGNNNDIKSMALPGIIRYVKLQHLLDTQMLEMFTKKKSRVELQTES